MNHEQFFEILAPQAIRARQEGSPLFPSVRLAQNFLETGGVIHPWNNLGGIKVGRGKPNEWWKGQVVNKGTWEVYGDKRVEITAAFRAYDSVYEFYRDQDRLLGKLRYNRVLSAKTPHEQASALQACGYATDPDYTDKLCSIIRSYNLEKYDVSLGKEEDTLELTKYQWGILIEILQRLLDHKVITDKSWVEKAKNGTLTVSELTWLNTVILANK